VEGELPGYSELAGFSCCSSASSCPSPHREVTWAREDFRATLGLCLQVWSPKTPLVGLCVGSKGFGFFCLYCCKTEGIFDLGDKFFPTVTRNVTGWLEPCKRKNAKKWNFLSDLNFRSTL
jgi:hypothetical protein